MQTKTIILTKDKDCKGSVRYAASAEAQKDFNNPPIITTLYLGRSFASPMPEKVNVTVVTAQ